MNYRWLVPLLSLIFVGAVAGGLARDLRGGHGATGVSTIAPVAVATSSPTVPPTPPTPTVAPSPTLTPTSAPTATPAPLVALTEVEVRALFVEAGWPAGEIDIGLCVALHESGYRYWIHNAHDPGAGSFGLMQIEAWWSESVADGGPRAGFPRFDLSRALDPDYNVSYALLIQQDAGLVRAVAG